MICMNNFNYPLVSVIIPAYNAEAFIRQTLDSVLAQTYQNIEVLVVDDGSQDQTAAIVESYSQKDSRVTLLKQANAGVAAARNLAIQSARGDYIAPIDADDIWYSQKLEKQVQCMLQSDPTVGLVYTWSVHIDEADRIIGEYTPDWITYKPEGDIYPILVYFNFLDNASTPLIRRACFEAVGDYNCELKAQNAQGCEDWDLYLRIAECYQFRVVQEFLVGYRQSIGSMASNCGSMAKSYHLVMQEVQHQHPEIPAVIYRWSNSFFYQYLLGKSYKSGDHWGTLRWLKKAVGQDLNLLLRPGLYPMLIVCLLKIIAKPVSCLIWPDHRSWLEFKQKLKPRQQMITLAEVKQQIQTRPKFHWKPYDRVLLYRWSHVMKICQEISF